MTDTRTGPQEPREAAVAALGDALRSWRRVYVDPGDPGAWYEQSASAILDALRPEARYALTAWLEETKPLRRTHGRHCPCTACKNQDWADPRLAPCGMHGEGCPAVYDPWPTYYQSESVR